MKYVKGILALCMITLMTANIAHAGSLAEKFKKFVLGPEAEAYSINHEERYPAVKLDSTTENCMNCHDGSRATHITIKDASAPYQIRGFRTLNHPIGMSYDKHANKKPRGFKRRQSLNQNIRLVDGKVSCISCHKLKKENQLAMVMSSDGLGRGVNCESSKELTVGPKEDDLCFACHNK